MRNIKQIDSYRRIHKEGKHELYLKDERLYCPCCQQKLRIVIKEHTTKLYEPYVITRTSGEKSVRCEEVRNYVTKYIDNEYFCKNCDAYIGKFSLDSLIYVTELIERGRFGAYHERGKIRERTRVTI